MLSYLWFYKILILDLNFLKFMMLFIFTLITITNPIFYLCPYM